MSDDLKSFKISDATPKGADRGSRKSAEGAATSSVGFPNVEAQVESDGPALQGLDDRYDLLVEMSKSGTPKDKAAAKKAALAYERAHGLLTHLLNTKQQMSGAGDEGEA